MMDRQWLGNFTQVVLLAALATPAFGRQHPSLVDPENARCSTCHQLVPPGATVHRPVEGQCLACHRFSKKAHTTEVDLAANQPELCLGCHKALAKAAKLELAVPHPPMGDQCTACHDPHASKEHHLLQQKLPKLCFSCHGEAEVQAKHPLPVTASSCISCHAAHGSEVKGMLLGQALHPPFAEQACQACHRKGLGSKVLLQRSGAALCFACHSQQEKEWGKGAVHGAVAKGQCTACHDPHLASQADLRRASGPGMCLGCHPRVQARIQARTVHPPAQEDCLTCHRPHQAETPGLLQAPAGELCGNCHDTSEASFAGKHLQARGKTLACVGCHDPHGSERPHLLADVSSHPPFTEGSCDACHQGSAQKLAENGSRQLCFACHSDTEAALARGGVHGALDAGECVACHSPHASRQASLLKAEPDAVCGGCHPDQLPGPGEKAHGAIAALGCQVCHLPHQGGTRLLWAEGADLCAPCHVARANSGKEVSLFGRFTVPSEQWTRWATLRLTPDGTRNHPVTGHRVLGSVSGQEVKKSTFRGELSCLTCHDPHKGAGRGLPRRDAQGKPVTCESCHAK